MLLSVLLIASILPPSVFADEPFIDEQNSVSILGYRYSKKNLTYKTIYDMNNNEYILIEAKPTGYYIYDPTSEQYIEGSPDAPSPYLNKSKGLLYLGPQNYYLKSEDNTYNHTLSQFKAEQHLRMIFNYT